MKLHFNKMCKHPCSVLKEKGLLVKTHDEELAMYPQCEALKKQMPEIDITDTRATGRKRQTRSKGQSDGGIRSGPSYAYYDCHGKSTLPESAGIDKRTGRQSPNRFQGLLARTASVTGRLENHRRVEVHVEEVLPGKFAGLVMKICSTRTPPSLIIVEGGRTTNSSIITDH